MENGLFIIGNKRSGSTHLMRLLNLHPQVFVSNESDVVWITRNIDLGKSMEPYPGDSPAGMEKALAFSGDVLSENASPTENFISFQKNLMKKGHLEVGPIEKEGLKFLGDQKPYQNGDPDLVPFILSMFPKAKFIHLVRHPFEVISSSMKFLNGTGGDIWKEMGPNEIFDKWVYHEKNALKSISENNLDSLRLDYSDLVRNIRPSITSLFSFLELEVDESFLKRCEEITYGNFKPIKNYEVPFDAKSIMQLYGYSEEMGFFERKILPKLISLKGSLFPS